MPVTTKKNPKIETVNSNKGRKAKEDVMKIIIFLAAMATVFAFAVPAMAQAPKPTQWCKPDGDCKAGGEDKTFNWQEDWTTCPVDCPVPADMPKVDFLDPIEKEIIFRYGEWTALQLATNGLGYKQFENWLATYAPDNFSKLFKSFVKEKNAVDAMDGQAKDFISPAAKTFGYFRLSDKDIAELEKAGEKFLNDRGCVNEADQGCRDLLKKASTYLWNVLNQILDENDKYVAMNFLKGFMTVQPRIKKKIFVTLAALDVLKRKHNRIIFEKGSGVLVPAAKLVDHTGDYVSAICFNAYEMVEGTIGELTDGEKVEIKGKGGIPFSTPCAYWVVETGTPSPCDQAKAAFDAKVPFEGKVWLACPAENLLGRKGFYFPEKCLQPVEVTVGETTSMGVVVNVGGKPLMVSCEDIKAGKIAFSPLTKEQEPELLTLADIQFELATMAFFDLVKTNKVDGAMAFGAMARLVWTPLASKGFAAHIRLGLGGMGVEGMNEYAIRNPSSRGDLLSSIGIGASALINRWFTMSIFGDVFFTTAGFGGGGGELQFRFKVSPRVSLFFGPTLGYLISGVKPGVNKYVEECVGTGCEWEPKKTEMFYLGYALGIGFNILGGNEPPKVETDPTPEPEAVAPAVPAKK